MDASSSSSLLTSMVEIPQHTVVRESWGYSTLNTVEDAYLEIDIISKRLKKPQLVATSIQRLILSLAHFRSTKVAYKCLQEGYARWIQNNVLPLNQPKTQVEYLAWMQLLAAAPGLYSETLSEDPGIAFLESKKLSISALTLDDFENLKKVYETAFGPEFYALPLATFLMKRYNNFSSQQRQDLITLLLSFPIKIGDEQEKQWTRELAKTVLSAGNVSDTIKILFEHEIQSTSDYRVLFRNASLATFCLNEYCRKIGSKWLTSILASVFSRLNHKKFHQLSADELGERVCLRIKRSLPDALDHSSVTDDRKKHAKAQLKRTDTLDVIVEMMPGELHDILTHVATRSELKFKELKHMYDSILYLRLICPCLLVPSELGLEVPAIIEAPPHKQLVELVRVLQRKANGT